MAELTMTDEERELPLMQWDDASLGRLMKKVIGDSFGSTKEEEAEAVKTYTPVFTLISFCSRLNSTQSSFEVSGVTREGESIGDWIVMVRKVEK